MKLRLIALLFCGQLILLTGCAELRQTGQTLRDDNGALMDAEDKFLGEQRYRITMRGSSLILDGQVEQQFKRHAEKLAKTKGCRDWKTLDYRAGNENTLLGARRYVEATIQCLP
ncbi:hypothetical protein KSF73_07390 [Burkholderiaceae bacterium DAT-1]|nr:hypothetical protein [Burkholderiaceae bacterium DAT-1]